MELEDIRSRLSEIEKNLYDDPCKIRNPEIFDFMYYMIRLISTESTNYPQDIIT